MIIEECGSERPLRRNCSTSIIPIVCYPLLYIQLYPFPPPLLYCTKIPIVYRKKKFLVCMQISLIVLSISTFLNEMKNVPMIILHIYIYMYVSLSSNQVRFLDAILSQNNTDDHMQEFIKQGGLEPMLKLLAITPLAAETSYTTANSAIIDTCRNILVCTLMKMRRGGRI